MIDSPRKTIAARRPLVERQCEFCESVFLALASRVDIGKAKFCSVKCQGAYRSTKGRSTITCCFCGVVFWIANYKVGAGQKYCSRKCLTDSGAISEWCSGNSGNKTSRHAVHISCTCEVCGEVRDLPPSQAAINSCCSHRCAGIKGARTLFARLGSTSIELAIEDVLVSLGIPYSPQHLLLNLTLADFFIEPDLVIYADGDYWHSLPGARRRDPYINKQLSLSGYRVLRFSESEIKANIEAVKLSIEGSYSASH